MIIRTAAYGARKIDMQRELKYLYRLQEVLQSRVEDSPAPSLAFQEADLSVRVVRDVFTREFERAVIDDEKQHHRVTSFFQRTAPELVDRVELYKGDDLFHKFGIENAFDAAMERRVDLPHGGYLMIDHAEALTVIDVNTGSYTGRGRGSLEDTIVKTNLQAAEEVVRQLRLRDIGGIIVIDFIDMAYTRNRDKVLDVLQAGARPGPHPHPRRRDLAARAGRDDAPERLRRRARDHEQDLPDLRGRGVDPLGGDDRDRRRAYAPQRWSRSRSPRPSWCRCTPRWPRS